MKEVFTMFKQCFLLFIALLFLTFDASAQFIQAASSPPGPKVFPLSELREGMRGTAKTVFRGNTSEDFQVEILGIVPNSIGPKLDLIIGRLSGANAERTFVFAGMSGSPVYIDGRLVGAISYSFPFAKEPICGITPFEQMSAAVEKIPVRNVASTRLRSFSYVDLLSNTLPATFSASSLDRTNLGLSADPQIMAVAGQAFQRISTPLYFSGISQRTLDTFAPQLVQAGLMPVAVAGGGSGNSGMKEPTETTLLGGDSVVVQLARGDIQLAAAGTVTHREGNKIYAFGHPFFSLGSSNLPMSESHVVVVVPNANNSFKLAVADSTVGAMTQDRSTGIYGLLGEAPKLLPVKVTLLTSRGRTVTMNFESAFDELLTPLIVGAGIGNALTASERTVGDSTIEVKGEITVKGEAPIRINRRFAGPQAAIFAASAPTIPLAALLRAGFEGLDITGINITMNAADGAKTASLDRITVDRTQVRPGDAVEISTFERTESGNYIVQKLPLVIPKDAPPGNFTLTVGDGSSVQQNTAITQFTPRNAAELIATINNLKRPDRLYVVLTRAGGGTIIGSSEMPNLPPSVLATLNNDRTAGGSKPTVQTIVAETELPSGEHIVSGSQSLTIEVVR
jgi:hypothetical protein